MNTIFSLTKPAILAHPKQLFEPKPFRDRNGKEQGDPRYSCQLVFDTDHPDWQALRKHALAVARNEFPEVKWEDFTKPFKSGTEIADKRKAENAKLVAAGQRAKPEAEYARGKGILTASSTVRPSFSIFEGARVVDLLEDAAIIKARQKFFFGAECLAQMNFAAGEVRGSKYVACYINLVVSTGKGKNLGGSRPTGSNVYAGYNNGSDADPTGGIDDEIPF